MSTEALSKTPDSSLFAQVFRHHGPAKWTHKVDHHFLDTTVSSSFIFCYFSVMCLGADSFLHIPAQNMTQPFNAWGFSAFPFLSISRPAFAAPLASPGPGAPAVEGRDLLFLRVPCLFFHTLVLFSCHAVFWVSSSELSSNLLILFVSSPEFIPPSKFLFISRMSVFSYLPLVLYSSVSDTEFLELLGMNLCFYLPPNTLNKAFDGTIKLISPAVNNICFHFDFDGWLVILLLRFISLPQIKSKDI